MFSKKLLRDEVYEQSLTLARGRDTRNLMGEYNSK
jgi:hypothetical protein